MPNKTDLGRYWGLLVGTNFYQDSSIRDLRFAVADAFKLYQLLISALYGFPEKNLTILQSTESNTNESTRRNILRHLDQKVKKTSEGDLLLFYYSGHGETINGESYLCPADVETSYLKDTAIPLSRIREIIAGSRASINILFLDACHLGSKLGVKDIHRYPKDFSENTKNVFRGMRGVAVLASSPQEEVSIEVEEKQHGAFTYYLIKALKDQRNVDENDDQFMSVTEIFKYVSERLRLEYQQEATMLLEGTGDFPVFPVKAPSMSASNPVRRVFPSAAKDSGDFFGRDDELRRIRETLLATSDILIVIQGEYFIGKTSFLNRIRVMLNGASSDNARFFYFSIEPSSVLTVEDFARELWTGLFHLCQATGKASLAGGLSFSFDGYNRFGFQLEKMLVGLENSRFVIFIDEFEQIKDVSDDINAKQIIGLIRYIIEQTNFPIAFVISTIQSSSNFLFEDYKSPPPSLTITLPPLDRADCSEMLSSLLPKFMTNESDLLERIFLASGGNPYVAKLLSAESFDRRESLLDGPLVSEKVWGDIVEESVQDVTLGAEIFRNLYNSFIQDEDERYVLILLATQFEYTISGREVANWRVAHRSAARSLIRRHYLMEVAGGGYRLSIPQMGVWLRQWKSLSVELERFELDNKDALSSIKDKGICIDNKNGVIYLDGVELNSKLPNLQYQALLYLARNADKIISKKELFGILHGENETYSPDDQGLDALIYRLRKSLDDTEKKYLQTVRKRGYRLSNATVV